MLDPTVCHILDIVSTTELLRQLSWPEITVLRTNHGKGQSTSTGTKMYAYNVHVPIHRRHFCPDAIIGPKRELDCLQL